MTATSPSDPRLLAGRVGGVADLVDVRLRRLTFDLGSVPETAEKNEVRADINIAFDRQPGALVYELRCEVVAQPSIGEPLFTADVVLSATYTLPEGVQIENEAVEAFGSVSVTFMLFPYLRELLQSLTTRAGLPALLLNVMRSPLIEAPTP